LMDQIRRADPAFSTQDSENHLLSFG